MKNLLKIMMFTMLITFVSACGEKKLTENDVKAAEAKLYNEDMTANTDAVPEVVETFTKFAAENTDNTLAPEYLFKAFEIALNFMDADKAIEIGNNLIATYPSFDKTPAALLLLGMKYEDVGELGKAKDAYEQLVKDYPDNAFVPSAQACIDNLGKTPEELIREFEAKADSIPETVIE